MLHVVLTVLGLEGFPGIPAVQKQLAGGDRQAALRVHQNLRERERASERESKNASFNNVGERPDFILENLRKQCWIYGDFEVC